MASASVDQTDLGGDCGRTNRFRGCWSINTVPTSGTCLFGRVARQSRRDWRIAMPGLRKWESDSDSRARARMRRTSSSSVSRGGDRWEGQGWSWRGISLSRLTSDPEQCARTRDVNFSREIVWLGPGIHRSRTVCGCASVSCWFRLCRGVVGCVRVLYTLYYTCVRVLSEHE